MDLTSHAILSRVNFKNESTHARDFLQVDTGPALAPEGAVLLSDPKELVWVGAYTDAGIEIKAAGQEVTFRYTPMWLYIGFAISAFSLVGSITALLIVRPKKKSRQS